MVMESPARPGEILREDVLAELGLSVGEAASRLGISQVTLSRVLRGHARLSPNLAVRLEEAGVGTAHAWLAMQSAHDLGAERPPRTAHGAQARSCRLTKGQRPYSVSVPVGEIEFRYNMFCWFTATSGPFPEWDQEAFSKPVPVSTDRRALKITRNMWSGPIRFEVLVDVDEAASAADFGPHERFEVDFKGDTCGYALQDLNHWVTVLEGLAPGDYRAILLVAGIDPAKFDSVCDESTERYRLLLQPVASSK